MNVLVIDKTGLEEKEGGMARAISTLMKALLSHGVGVVRLIPGPWYQYVLEKENKGQVTVYRMAFPLPCGPGSKVKNLLVWFIRFPKAIYQLKKIVDCESIDIIHTNYHSENICVWVCHLLWKIKYVVNLHGSESFLTGNIPFFHRWLVKIVVRGADAVVPVSDGVEKAARKSFGNDLNYVRIHNGIMLDEFLCHSGTAHVTTQIPAKYIVTVGALVSAKGHDVLLEAWGRLCASFPDVSLVVVGDGPERGRYEELCRELGIQNSVQFLGWQNHLDTLAILSKAILHVLPSRSEGLGLVLLEAGALKVVNVATDVGGIPEIIDNGKYGVLVPSEDPPAMAQAISHLLNNEHLRKQIEQDYHVYVRNIFSAKTMASRYVELYETILS